MKTLGVQSKFFALVASVCLLSLGSTLKAAQADATLTQSSGPVTGASVGEALSAGSVISTGAGGSATISINGDTIVLAENSTLSLDILDTDETGVETVSNIQLTLSAGRIYGKVGRSSSLSMFVVKIPKGQVAIDATAGPVVFDISANGETLVGEGSVEVTFDRGTNISNLVTRRLSANQAFNPVTGNVGPGDGSAIPDVTVVRVATPAAPTQPFQFFISPNLGQN